MDRATGGRPCVLTGLNLMHENTIEQVIRDTLVAAANMDYPKDKLVVCICDDGKNREGACYVL